MRHPHTTEIRIAASALASALAILPAGLGCTSNGTSLRSHSEQIARLDSRRKLAQDLDAILDDPKYANAFWGVRIERPTGEVLFERNSKKSFAPASNMKLFTTAAACDLLGPNYTYKTNVDIVGSIAKDGTLVGDLIIVGSGDPSLGAWHPDPSKGSKPLLDKWVQAVRDCGIKCIKGNIIGDGRCFTKDYYGGTWDYYDLPYWYATGSSGLAMEENAYRITITPGNAIGNPAKLTLNPQTSYITLVNETITVAAGGNSDADGAWQQTEGNTKRYNGTIAFDKKIINERGSVWDGAKYAAHLLLEELERTGVTVEGEAVNIRDLPNLLETDDTTSPDRKTIITTTSPPMSEIIRVINKPSHNFFADQVVRTIGMIKEGEGSFEAGTRAVAKWLEKIGASDTHTFRMYDGSGLAAYNLVQPQQVCQVLQHMRHNPNLGRIFHDSLPIAGKESGLRNRMKWPSTEGNVHAKTGYISNVRALSGYVTDADNEELVFSMICNRYTISTKEVNASQDKICRILALYSEELDLTGDCEQRGDTPD